MRLEALIRTYRDLTLLEQNPVEVVVFLTGSIQVETTGLWRPYLQGALKDSIPYYIDVVGYMFKQRDAEGGLTRSLLVDEQPGYVAKDGTDRLVRAYPGGIIPNPDLSTMHDLLKINGKPESIQATQEVAVA